MNDPRNDYSKNVSHKRQTSSLHGHFNHSKGHSLTEQSPTRSPKEPMYGTAPDLPPRVDRAVKPLGLLTTPGKITNGYDKHNLPNKKNYNAIARFLVQIIDGLMNFSDTVYFICFTFLLKTFSMFAHNDFTFLNYKSLTNTVKTKPLYIIFYK